MVYYDGFLDRSRLDAKIFSESSLIQRGFYQILKEALFITKTEKLVYFQLVMNLPMNIRN